tara:strand:+ start:843 stop:1148 length:306 start_codon:yes stop_codon:yes gene_type:complete
LVGVDLEKEKPMNQRRKAVTTVPVGGAVLMGKSPWSAYEAAKRGEIETIQIGKHLGVSVAWMEGVTGVGPGELDDEVEANEIRIRAEKVAKRDAKKLEGQG